MRISRLGPCFQTIKRSKGISIPGLKIEPNFLNSYDQKKVQKKAIQLAQKILQCMASNPIQTRITHLSKSHNLKSKEYYQKIRIEDEFGGKLAGQYFEEYGEKGHQLTYFIGNQNLPEFIKTVMLPRALQMPEIKRFSQNRSLNWNFTFNTYAPTKDRPSRLPGFGDFHKDIKSNGEITMIYSCGAPSELQIRLPQEPDGVQSFPLHSNGLILLSNEARWDYEHCVIPVATSHDPSPFDGQIEPIKRISLVLGCHQKQ